MARNTEFLKAGEAARILGAAPSTLANWERAGILKPDRKLPSGHRLYKRESLERFMKESYKYQSR